VTHGGSFILLPLPTNSTLTAVSICFRCLTRLLSSPVSPSGLLWLPVLRSSFPFLCVCRLHDICFFYLPVQLPKLYQRQI
jgi:hypothetical protein